MHTPMQRQLYKSSEETALMSLVCSGLRNTEPDEELLGGLSAEQWEDIYRMAKRQTVCGICYNAFSTLSDRSLPPDSVMMRWVARVNAIEATNRRMSEVEAALIDLLRKSGLHPVVQKGLSIARLYDTPELRECGDIDLWLPGEEIKVAVRIAGEISPLVKRNPDHSASFMYKGFVVELHSLLIHISHPGRVRTMDQYTIKLCTEYVDHSNPLPSPPPLLELLLVNVHIMRHAFGTGIGLRQICDYYCAVNALYGKYDPCRFEMACRALGISKWTAMLHEFLIRYFEAPESILPPCNIARHKKRVSPEALLNIIREGGNFGLHIRDKNKKIVQRGKLHTLSMFLRRSRFALSVAPTEAFFGFLDLTLGQLYSRL